MSHPMPPETRVSPEFHDNSLDQLTLEDSHRLALEGYHLTRRQGSSSALYRLHSQLLLRLTFLLQRSAISPEQSLQCRQIVLSLNREASQEVARSLGLE